MQNSTKKHFTFRLRRVRKRLRVQKVAQRHQIDQHRGLVLVVGEFGVVGEL